MQFSFLLAILFIFSVASFAEEEEHEHTEGAEHSEHADHAEHKGHNEEREGKEGHEEGHSHGHKEEGEEHEAGPQVGPDKGITAADEHEGIKLSPEAEKNFEITRVKASAGATELPRAAVVTAGIEVNLFRYRSGFYKRIDFDFVQKSGEKVTVRSKELRSGDEIVVNGLGYLRIAEIAAFGGAPEGHSH